MNRTILHSKNLKTCRLQQVGVILAQGPLKLQTSNGHCIFHRAWTNYCKATLERYWSVQYCTEGRFEKFLVMKKILPFEAKLMNYDFFEFLVFSSFGHIFKDISITRQRLCFWDRTGRHLSFETNFNEIGEKKIFSWKK